jgi:hypothetical protein
VFLEVVKDGVFLGTIHVCHACGLHGPRRRKRGLPARWVERTEPQYGPDGRQRRSRRRGLVFNYYCPGCVAARCTAATVAKTRLLCQREAERERERRERQAEQERQWRAGGLLGGGDAGAADGGPGGG